MADGQPHARADVAATLHYTNVHSSGFTKVLGRLHKALGLVEYVHTVDANNNNNNKKTNQYLQLSNVCCPFGRPGK